MADSRLVWNQVVAPDLSAASQALARANAAFTAGMGAGSEVLSKYQEGLEKKGDDELLAELAGLGTEEEFDSFVDGGGLQGRTLSAGMREHVLGARAGLVDMAGTRARTGLTGVQTQDTLGRLAIARAAEGRTQSEYNYGVNRRNELAGLSGLIVGANQEGNLYGTDGIQREIYQGLLRRGMPQHIAQGFMMNFQDESGFNPGIEEAEPNVHGTRGRGLYQLTGDRRAAYEAQYGQDYSIDNQLDFLMQELSGSESAARERIWNTRTAGEAGEAIVGSFLRPAEEHRIARAQRYRASTPQADALMAALAGSQYLLPGEISGMMGDVRTAQNSGQARIDAAEADRINALGSQAILDMYGNPEIMTPAQATASVIGPDSPLRSQMAPDDLLAQAARAAGVVSGDPGYFNPTVPEDPLIAATIAREQELNAAEAAQNPTELLRQEAEQYNSNPAQTLIDNFDLNDSAESRLTIERTLREMVQNNDSIATMGEAAAALGRTYSQASAAWRALPGDSTYGVRNFDVESASGILADLLSRQGQMTNSDASVANARTTAEFEAARTQLAQARSQAARYTRDGREIPADLAQEINSLQRSLSAGQTPREGLEGVEFLRSFLQEQGLGTTLMNARGTDRWDAAVRTVRQRIETASNMTQADKDQLLAIVESME